MKNGLAFVEREYTPLKIPYPENCIHHSTIVQKENLFETMKFLIGMDVYVEYSAQIKFSNHYDEIEFEIIDNELIIYDEITHLQWYPVEDVKINLNTIRRIWFDNFGEFTFELSEYNEYIKIGRSYKQDMLC